RIEDLQIRVQHHLERLRLLRQHGPCQQQRGKGEKRTTQHESLQQIQCGCNWRLRLMPQSSSSGPRASSALLNLSALDARGPFESHARRWCPGRLFVERI